MFPRGLRAIVGSDEMARLEGFDPRDLNRAMINTVGISTNQRLEIFNRMLNIVSENEAVEMYASTLARNPEPAGSYIQFEHHRDGLVQGRLGNVMASAKGDVAIEVDGELKVVSENRAVKVWPLQEQPAKSQVCGERIGYHLAYGLLVCDLAQNHTSAHEQENLPARCEKTRNGRRCTKNAQNSHVHDFSKAIAKLRDHKQPPSAELTLDWTEYQAEFFWLNRDWMTDGREVQFQDGFVGVVGKLTDAWSVDGRIYLVIDGKINSVLPNLKVKVFTPRIRARV